MQKNAMGVVITCLDDPPMDNESLAAFRRFHLDRASGEILALL